VNVVTFGGKRYTFDMTSVDTIANLKQRIQEKERLAPPIFERSKVCWEDPYHEKQSLKDDLTISHYSGAATMHVTTEMVRTPQIAALQSARSHPAPPPSLPALPNRPQSVPSAATRATPTRPPTPTVSAGSSLSTAVAGNHDSEPEIRAVDTALTGKSVFITGPAGTAKVWN
jgi:hypothetical protein